MSTIDDLTKGDRQRVLSLADVAGVNLAETWLTVDDSVLTVVKEEEDGQQCFLELQHPTLIRSQFSMAEWQPMEELLRENCVRYTVNHHPPYHFKGQGNRWRATLELWLPHRHQVTITLSNVGVLYSVILLNGVSVVIQHGGGSGRHPGWVNTSDGFYLVGKARIQALKSLITCLGQKK
jgi:hypothetical protein